MRHIVWVNEEPRFVGGCESYMVNTAAAMARLGYRNSLLYHFDRPVARDFAAAFDGVYPLVDLERQLSALAPDVIYVQRWADIEGLITMATLPWPAVRMFHDAAPFCLRGHGMGYFSGRYCPHTLGWRCLLDGGFVKRSAGPLGVGYASLGEAQAVLAVNRQFDGFVVASQYMAEVLRRHGFDGDRVTVLPLFVREPVQSPPVERDERLVLFVGQLVRGKGVDVLFEALSLMHDDVRCVVIGSGNGAPGLQRLAADRGLCNVTFLPRVPQAELASWYGRALCTVVPSRQAESFCLVGPESFSYATPVVGVNLGAVPEWLDDGRNGLLVPPYDPAALAGALQRLVRDPSLARDLGRRGREDFERRYRADDYARRLARVLGAVIDGRIAEVAA